MAQNLVSQAEQQLLAYNSNDQSESKPSLSEQLAAYGESLSLQREVAAGMYKGRKVSGTSAGGSRAAYTWEKLGRDGNRTVLTQSEAPSTQFAGVHEARSAPLRTVGSQRPFQQGQLDVRRPPAPSLRQDASRKRSYLPRLAYG